ncbi:MAG: hypothetical protein LBC18_01065 [Opitutaceae bacterium]|jgi:hypothetical protein|nr:hypothetical protein [Opitutaceae bacterium]
MKNYVSQLVEKLRAARALVITPPYVELEPEFDIPEIRGAEEFLAGPQDNFEGYFKIRRAEFPPDDRLTAAQIKTLANEMLSLLAAHNFAADLPDDITPRDAYNALLRRWDGEPVSYVSSGHSHLDFYDDPELERYYAEWKKEIDAEFAEPASPAPAGRRKKTKKSARVRPRTGSKPETGQN